MMFGFDKDYSMYRKAALDAGLFSEESEQVYKGAKRGDPALQYEFAHLCLEARLDDVGLSWLVRSGLSGYAKAEYEVGKYIIDFGDIEGPSSRGETIVYNDPVIWLTKAAKHRNPESAALLAKLALSKPNPDHKAAAEWYKRSDELGGECDSMLVAKQLYDSGDAAGALKYYKKAAAKGEREAMVAAGKLCLEIADRASAKEYFSKAAEISKDSELMYLLATCKLSAGDNRGAYLDLQSAASLLSYSPDLELADRIYEKLGDMIGEGIGCPADGSKAAGYYSKVKNFENDESRMKFAGYKFRGVGTMKDVEYAASVGLPDALYEKYKNSGEREYLERAAISGFPEAMHEYGRSLFNAGEYEKAIGMLEECCEDFDGDDYVIALCYSKLDRPAKAIKYYAHAADKGNSEAEFMIGRHYAAGYGIDKDPKEAFAWFKRSAMHGDPTGLYELGMCIKNGVGTAKNPNRGMEMIKTAAENGSAPAMYALAGALRVGAGVKQDRDLAITYFLKSAELGYEPAIYQVGFLYEVGYITGERDFESALPYYKRCEPGYKDTAKRISNCILEISNGKK